MLKRVELTLRPEEAASEENYQELIANKISISVNEITEFKLAKRSIDARSRQVKYHLYFDVSIGESLPEKKTNFRHYLNVSNAKEIHIVGFGPAGMFAALRCIELGYKPIVIERGKDVRSRRRDLAAINKEGVVNRDSNYCFGEGGAGTYSDGKLYTRSSKRGSIERILNTFVEFGASEEILIDAHPHIGTNKLPGIVSAMRERIIECGGDVHFETRLESIQHKNGQIIAIEVLKTDGNNHPQTIKTNSVILATGHSARDIFKMLHEQKILIEQKDFALGVRIEHPQNLIDKIQYHCDDRGEFLPPSSYSLTGQVLNRGVYSFCMCPGGIIAPAATAPNEIVVNGWSPSKRNNPFANSGMVVSVGAEDFLPFKKHGPLAALEFQSMVEQNCFKSGGGKLVAPAQRMVDFCEGKASKGELKTSYLPGVSNAFLADVLPKEVANALRLGLKEFGKKMKGYYTNEAILVGTESRTSSPVRIPRDATTLMHPEIKGLFPCAEGAGYAGGIASAAMDGERCAESLIDFLEHN
jgi:uncharacterized FAD-dependent dehydrogenase